MSKRIHALAQRLLGKATIDECNLDEVRVLAQRFPYFAPAQFLLLEKLKTENPEDYSTQLQKAILYYHNPLEFQYFISSDKFLTEPDFSEDGFVKEPDATGFYTENAAPETIPEEISTEPEAFEHNTSDINEPVEEPLQDYAEKPIAEISSSPIEVNGFEQNLVVDKAEPVEQDNTVPDSLTIKREEEHSTPEETADKLPSLPKSEMAKNNSGTGLTFEPYHTVDYFASQGIRLSQEELPKDKLGKQLKSFTEWLKTMKRLPATQMQGTVDAGTESKVQHMAEDSIHEADVWTEAMAEVWTKQGNTQKAIETYNKLSLLNPSKKAYFASKIENLKRS